MNNAEIEKGYISFINKEIMPTINEEMIPIINDIDRSRVDLLSNRTDNKIELRQEYAYIASLKHRSYQRMIITYTPSQDCYNTLKPKENDFNRVFKVSDQNSFFDFVMVCIDKDMSAATGFNTRDELFQYLKGLIDNKQYINQYRAAFTPSPFPEMNMWRQSEFYEFVDTQFKQKLLQLELYEFIDNQFKQKLLKEANTTVSITSVEPDQRSISFRRQNINYIYTSNSKYYRSIIPKHKNGYYKEEQVVDFKIDNNNPYFMFILRCLNKDKKVLSYSSSHSSKLRQFTREGLATYLDKFISDARYIKEYDTTFIPVKVDSKTNQQLQKKYSNFIRNEIEKKVEDMIMVSTDGGVLFFWYRRHHGRHHKRNHNFKIALVSDNIFDEYKNSPEGRKIDNNGEIYAISSDNPNFNFILQCLNHNSTEATWVKFKTNKELLGYLENLPFNQQCKEDYIQNFKESGINSTPSTSNTYLPIGQSNDTGLPALYGSSSSTASVSIAPTALLVFVLLQSFWSPLSSLYNYISYSISDQKAKNNKRKKDSDRQPSSDITEINESQIQLLGKKWRYGI